MTNENYCSENSSRQTRMRSCSGWKATKALSYNNQLHHIFIFKSNIFLINSNYFVCIWPVVLIKN